MNHSHCVRVSDNNSWHLFCLLLRKYFHVARGCLQANSCPEVAKSNLPLFWVFFPFGEPGVRVLFIHWPAFFVYLELLSASRYLNGSHVLQLGGVNENISYEYPQLQFKHFSGCIRNLLVDSKVQHGASSLPLREHSLSWGLHLIYMCARVCVRVCECMCFLSFG